MALLGGQLMSKYGTLYVYTILGFVSLIFVLPLGLNLSKKAKSKRYD